MNQSRFVKNCQRVEQLFGKDSHKTGAQASERVLLDEFV